MFFYNFYHYCSLGDCWRVVTIAALTGEQTGMPVILSTKTKEGDALQRVREILALVDTKATIKMTSHFGGREIKVNQFVPTLKTKKQWTFGPQRKKICYQFDGKYLAEYKNCTNEDIYEFLTATANKGIETFNLGGYGSRMPLAVAIEHILECDCFVGVCSGMAQLCYSVGIPVILIKNKQFQDSITNWHGDRPYGIFNNLPELLKSDFAKDGFVAKQNMVTPVYKPLDIVPETAGPIKRIVEIANPFGKQSFGCISKSSFKDSYYYTFNVINKDGIKEMRISLVDDKYRFRDVPKQSALSLNPYNARFFEIKDALYMTYNRSSQISIPISGSQNRELKRYETLYLGELEREYWFTDAKKTAQHYLPDPEKRYETQIDWLPIVDGEDFYWMIKPSLIYKWDIAKSDRLEVIQNHTDVKFGNIISMTNLLPYGDRLISFFSSDSVSFGVLSFECNKPFKLLSVKSFDFDIGGLPRSVILGEDRFILSADDSKIVELDLNII